MGSQMSITESSKTPRHAYATFINRAEFSMWHTKMTRTITCHTHTHTKNYESKVRGKTVWVALLSLETCLCSCHMQRNVASANNILIFIYFSVFLDFFCCHVMHVAARSHPWVGGVRGTFLWVQSLDGVAHVRHATHVTWTLSFFCGNLANS